MLPLQKFSPQLITFLFFLPVSLLSLCHATWGSGSYQQFSLLPCRDCKGSGWRKLLLRDEIELRSSEPLANVSWRGLFSAFCSLSDVLLVNLTALERKWQKSSFCLSLTNRQSGRAGRCIATDGKTSIWRHWNKIEQSQRAIVKDRDFRQLCSVVAWIMLKNSVLLLLQWNCWVLTNMSLNCLFLLPLTELFFNNSDKFSLHFCTGIIKLRDYSPKVWDHVASIMSVSKTFLCCSSRSIGSAAVCEQKRGNIDREAQHLLLH